VKDSLNDCNAGWHGRRKDFFQGRALADFFTGNRKDFSRGAKSDEILFLLLEINKTTLFAKNVIEKFQIPRGCLPPCSHFRRPCSL